MSRRRKCEMVTMGRATLAREFMEISEEVALLVNRLRKPASLTQCSDGFEAVTGLSDYAQSLCEISQKIALGHLDILEMRVPEPVPMLPFIEKSEPCS